MSKSTQTHDDDDSIETITASNGTEFPADVYEQTGRACYDSQRQVTNAWCEGKLPTRNMSRNSCVLYSSRNFKGYQRPDGSGRIQHYSTTEAIRTRSGLVINNAECWSKGWARCSPPRASERDHSLPLTTLESSTGTANVRHIVGVEKNVGDTGYTLVEYDESPQFVFLKELDTIAASGDDYFDAFEAANGDDDQ